jgi:hypothetical protein
VTVVAGISTTGAATAAATGSARPIGTVTAISAIAVTVTVLLTVDK